MLNKEIRQLEPEEATDLLCYSWTKAWGGSILHFFIDARTTLCGKTLTSHLLYSWRLPARGRCASCSRKHKLLVNKATEMTDGKE